MRRLLAVLRADDEDEAGPLAPSPGLDDLGMLVAATVRSGLPVEVRIEGDREPLPAGAELTAYRNHVVIVDHGRLVRAAPLADLAGPPGVAVRTPQAGRLRAALAAAGIAADSDGADVVVALDTTPEVVGRLIAELGLVVYELRLLGGSLEDTFLSLTNTPEGIR